MLSLPTCFMRLFPSGSLLWNKMGPSRRSSRIQARTTDALAPTKLHTALVTPRALSSQISNAKLRQFGSLKEELETDESLSDDDSGDGLRLASEEFSRRERQVPQLKEVKRKLNFTPSMSGRRNSTANAKPGQKMKAWIEPASPDSVIHQPLHIVGKVGHQLSYPTSKDLLGSKVERKGKVEQEHANIDDTVKPRPQLSVGLGHKRKRGPKVKTEETEEDEKTKIPCSERQRGGKDVHRHRRRDWPRDFASKTEPAVEERSVLADMVKDEPLEDTGVRRRNLADDAFGRVTKVKSEDQENAKRITGIRKGVVKREGRDSLSGITRVKVEDHVEEGNGGGIRKVLGGQDGYEDKVLSQKSKVSEVIKHTAGRGHGLQLVRVQPVGGAQLATERVSSTITLSGGPYPLHSRPFPEECQQAKDLLSSLHGHLPEYERHKQSCPTIEHHLHSQPMQSLAPASIESEISSGDGSDGKSTFSTEIQFKNVERAIVLRASAHEDGRNTQIVPTNDARARGTVLDSLVGTLLSQNTTDNNSRKAFASLKLAFPTWDKVLRASPVEIEDVIRCGGLAEIKAARIHTILDTLWKERGDISLEYLRDMSNEAIKAELSRFKGVGPKTVACVLMFHLQRKEFPVDTHVFRISKMLGWVPENADREKAYLHLNQRIPDHLKFDIHCLFVTHGKSCPKCAKRHNQKAADGPCPLINWKTKWSKLRQTPPLAIESA